MGADDWERVHGKGSYQELIDAGCSPETGHHNAGCSHRAIIGSCEHRYPNEPACGARSAYVVSVGQRRHDAQASCERHLGDTVAALAYAEEPPPNVTVTATAPLLRALTDAADARDRFREQARILGEQKAEWLCEACNVIHPWRDGDRFTAECPECGWSMVPTSASVRALQEARGRADAAEEKLARVRSVLLEGGQDAGTARRRALAIIAGEGGHSHGGGDLDDGYDRDMAGPAL